MNKGLSSSRWASNRPNATSRPFPSHSVVGEKPVQPASSASHSSLQRRTDAYTSSSSHNDQPSSPEQQLSRFLKIVARLKWKIPFLELGYAVALDRAGKLQQEIDANEIHFKLDFHEFYMLIERALVHLMGVYGITISAQGDLTSKNQNGIDRAAENTEPGAFRGRGVQHQYHENVLLALDNPANPLHETLGEPGVRRQLARAKELRNRWKYADDANSGRFVPAPLEAYNLEEILQAILLALERAYFVTEFFVRQRSPGTDQDRPMSAADSVMDSDDWEFWVDAMDWEVV